MLTSFIGEKFAGDPSYAIKRFVLAVNSDLVKFIENAPDAVLTLTTGEKIMCARSTEQVVERIIAFRRAVLIVGLLAVGRVQLCRCSFVAARWSASSIRLRGVSRVDQQSRSLEFFSPLAVFSALLIEGPWSPRCSAHRRHDRLRRDHRGGNGQFPLNIVLQAFKRLANVFLDKADDPTKLVKELVGYAQRARKDGIVSLDSELQKIKDPFLKKTLMLAVDGTEPEELRKIMELEIDNQAEQSEKIAQVFESAGGFAPTIGIIGAVLGLIQVMQHLQNIDEVGRGIAVAFVATIYGVGSANLLFLPSSGKLKIKSRKEQTMREMTLDGVVSILEGMNPRMLETKLFGYLIEHKQPEPERT